MLCHPIPTTRRQFLRSSALIGGTALVAPTILPSSVFGANAPSKRVTLGIIGCGNQATVDLPEFFKNDDCQVIAVCDVNKASFGYKTPRQFLGREPVRDLINDFYAKSQRSGLYKGCDIYSDSRELLARKDLDAVAIIGPDHWHAIMTIQAAAAGKDIYCQKPLGLTVRDGQEMIKAVRRHKRILQTGSQYRSYAVIRRACELVRSGRLGKIKCVESYVAANNFKGPGPGWKPAPVPAGFDYNFWLGPAPDAPYHPDRCLYKFRFIRDYSGGQTTNFGAHSNDIVQWALGMDHTGPVEFSDRGAEFPPAGDLFNTATKVNFRACYANGIELDCFTDKRSFGALRRHRRLALRKRPGHRGLVARDQGRRDRPQRTAPAGQREPLSQFHRLREVAAGSDRAGRGGPPHRQPLPPRQHRDAPPTHDQMGSEEGGDRRRRRGVPPARPAAARTVELPGVGVSIQ